jgi:hypothetical protein
MNLIAAAVGVGRIQRFMDADEMAGVEHLASAADAPAPWDAPPSPVKPAANGAANGAGGKRRGTKKGRGKAVELAAPKAAAPLPPPVDARRGGGGADQWEEADGGEAAVVIERGSFAWAAGAPPVLRDVELRIPEGALVLIVGPVGSGKSSLLAAALGEMAPAGADGGAEAEAARPPRVAVAGRVAYTAQDPWIQNATLKVGGGGRVGRPWGSGCGLWGCELWGRVPKPRAVRLALPHPILHPPAAPLHRQANVLMGAPLEEERYARVIDVCCLEKDLEVQGRGGGVGRSRGANSRLGCRGFRKGSLRPVRPGSTPRGSPTPSQRHPHPQMLPAGDESEIGEKGINLSGGQKHRVALARAAYADADVVLMDDPLSAVDAHVGSRWVLGGRPGVGWAGAVAAGCWRMPPCACGLPDSPLVNSPTFNPSPSPVKPAPRLFEECVMGAHLPPAT